VFKHTRLHISTNELLFAKGVFPYEYFNLLDKFDETSLPPKDAFYNNLTMRSISDEEYMVAQNVWQTSNV
jgi:hypothetical protein